METKMVPRRPVTTVTTGESKKKLIEGVNILSNAVKSTLGVAGRTVIIEDAGGNPHATKDGVTVAKSIYLKDTVQNMGAMIVRQAAINTGKTAGDGTTTSTVLAQDIINSKIPSNIGFADLKKGMDNAVEQVFSVLDANVKEVSKGDIQKVATISTNNDVEMGKKIAEAFLMAGPHGMVIMDESPTKETFIEMTEGMEVDRGYRSHHFINDKGKGKVVFNRPLVFISESKIDIPSQIDFVLGFSVNSKRPLLIFAEVSEEVLGTLIMNKLEGNIQVCIVEPPSYGYRRRDTLEDMGVACGCKIVSEQTGDNFQQISPEYIGEVESVMVTSDNTVLMLGERTKDPIMAQVKLLSGLKDSAKEVEAEWYKERIANLSSAVAIVKVGGDTDIERKEKKDRVDDAIHAVEAALESGTVVGGGVALLRCFDLIGDSSDNATQRAGFEIVRRSLVSPFRQIIVNAGVDKEQGYKGLVEKAILSEEDFDKGYDILNRKIVDLREIGVIDPIKVVKTALSNAVSAAYNILSTDNVITFG